MWRIFLVLFMISSFAMAQTPDNQYYLLVGTYTNADKTNGIHVYTYDAETGEAREQSKALDVRNPSYLAISKDKRNVYAVSEAGEGKGVNAFAFDVTTGKLAFLNSASAGGESPCYISIDGDKKAVFVGNYGSGTLSATRLKADGSLSDDTQVIAHSGSGVNKSRQQKPHVHSTVLSPDDRYLLVADLGTDKINMYRFDPDGEKLLSPAAQPYVSTNPGGGPRHITFHPNGKYAYLILEMEGAIVTFDYKDGTLRQKQSITMLAPAFKGDVGAADIHISPDGNFLYGSNRGDANDIVIYAIGKNGKLTYAGRQSSGIKTPRGFAIDPAGNYLLVGNQAGNDIVIFKRDHKTGLLTPTNKRIKVDKPVCLKFVSVGA